VLQAGSSERCDAGGHAFSVQQRQPCRLAYALMCAGMAWLPHARTLFALEAGVVVTAPRAWDVRALAGAGASLTRGRRARAQAAARALLPVPVAAARAVAAEPRGRGRPAQAAQGVLQALRRGGQRAAGRGGMRLNLLRMTARKVHVPHVRNVSWYADSARAAAGGNQRVMPRHAACILRVVRRQRQRA
jgi:hypothetical protein